MLKVQDPQNPSAAPLSFSAILQRRQRPVLHLNGKEVTPAADSNVQQSKTSGNLKSGAAHKQSAGAPAPVAATNVKNVRPYDVKSVNSGKRDPHNPWALPAEKLPKRVAVPHPQTQVFRTTEEPAPRSTGETTAVAAQHRNRNENTAPFGTAQAESSPFYQSPPRKEGSAETAAALEEMQPETYPAESGQLWAHLYDNLRRALNGVIYMCELDGDVVRCQEAHSLVSQAEMELKQLYLNLSEVQPSQVTDDWEHVSRSHGTEAFLMPQPSPLSGVSLPSHTTGPWTQEDGRSVATAYDSAQRSGLRATPEDAMRDDGEGATYVPHLEIDLDLEIEEDMLNFDKPRTQIFAASWGDMALGPAKTTVSQKSKILHDKLSSPDRKRKTSWETQRHLADKQARAEHRRTMLEESKVQRGRETTEKIQAIKESRAEQLFKKHVQLISKLDKSEQIYEEKLQAKRTKAENENMKVDEVAFITTMTAVNHRQRLDQRMQESEARRRELQEQRVRQAQTESAAKAEKVNERRKQMEAVESERQKYILEKQERAERRRQTRRGTSVASLPSSPLGSRSTADALLYFEGDGDHQNHVVHAFGNSHHRSASVGVAGVKSVPNTPLHRRRESDVESKDGAPEVSSATILTVPYPPGSARGSPSSRFGAASAHSASTTSLHKLVGASPRTVPAFYCALCKVKLLTDEHRARHLEGKRHKLAAQQAPTEERNIVLLVDPAPVAAPASSPDPEKAAASAANAAKNKKKKYRKIRQTLAQHAEVAYAAYRAHMGLDAVGAADTAYKTKVSACVRKLLQPSTSGPALLNVLQDIVKNTVNEPLPSYYTGSWDTPSARDSARDAMLIAMVETIVKRVCEPTVAEAKSEDWPLSSLEDSKSALLQASVRALLWACQNPQVRRFLLLFNHVIPLVHIIMHGLIEPAPGFLPELLQIVSRTLLEPLEIDKAKATKFEILKYISLYGLVHRISQRMSDTPKDAVDASAANQRHLLLYLQLLHLLEALTNYRDAGVQNRPVFTIAEVGQPVLNALHETTMAGILTLAEVALQPPKSKASNAAGSKHDALQARTLSPLVVSIMLSALRVLNNIARLDLKLFQDFASHYQMQLYHILALLLPHASAHVQETGVKDLLDQLILFVGYYTVLNAKNQEAFRWGQSPTLLQRLCNVPFSYFCDEKDRNILLPTLLAVSYKNRANVEVMSSEINTDLIAQYLDAACAASGSVAVDESKQDSKQGDEQLHRATQSSEQLQVPVSSPVYNLRARFPVDLLTEALKFFQGH